MKDYMMIKRKEQEDEHKREMDKLKLKIQIAEKASSESNSQHFMSSKPKLPKFDEDKDDMDVYYPDLSGLPGHFNGSEMNGLCV